MHATKQLCMRLIPRCIDLPGKWTLFFSNLLWATPFVGHGHYVLVSSTPYDLSSLPALKPSVLGVQVWSAL